MTRYFAQNTPRAGLEHMMMSVPGFQKRGGGMMILSRFCYKPEDVDCRYCLHYRRRSCQVRTCPYIAERLKSGAIEYLDLILEYFGHIPHAGLHKRIQAVEHWSGPDQAVLHTVSVHLRSRFADRVWDDAPPGYLAALYLLASKERLWQPALPALSHDSIDFSRIVSKPHGFAIQDYGQLTTYTFHAILNASLSNCRSGIFKPFPKSSGGGIPDGSGERLNGIQEVSGSIPLISTKNNDSHRPNV